MHKIQMVLRSFLTQPWADVWAEAIGGETLAEGAVNEAGMPMEVRMGFSAAVCTWEALRCH